MANIPGLPFKEGDRVAGKYRIERVIGTGGMGVVVAARHEQLDQLVAIKFVREEVLESISAVELFVRGARAAVRLKSEHTAKVLDAGTLRSGAPYMVMELLEGHDLGDVLKRVGPVTIGSAVHLIMQACDAVGEAHSAGIVHRDLKPENLFLSRTPNGPMILKVLDFGVSKTDPLVSAAPGVIGDAQSPIELRTLVGSPLYMSPEQMRCSQDVDARADVWALGVVLFELLTLRWPFEAETLGDLYQKVATEPPVPLAKLRPDLPVEFLRVVEICLEKDPAKRFPSARELAMALTPFAGRASSRGMPPGPAPSSAAPVSVSSTPMPAAPIDSMGPLSPSALLSRHRQGSPERVNIGRHPTPLNSRGSSRSFRPLPRRLRMRVAIAGATIAAVGTIGWLVGDGWSRDSARDARTTARPPQSAVQGVTDSEILLGMSGAFSGPSRELGNQMKLGIETAFSEIGDRGGVAGRKIRVVALDDEYEAARAGDTIKELIVDRSVFAVIGNVGTATAQVAAPYAVAHRTLFFGAFSGSQALRLSPPDRYVFNYRASYDEEAVAMVHYLVDVKKIRPHEVVVFAQRDAFGDDGFGGVVKMMRKYGRSDSDILRTSYERNSVDVDRAVGEVIAYNNAVEHLHLPDGTDVVRAKHAVRAVVLVATYKPAAKFVEKIRDRGLSPLFLNLSFVDSNALMDELKEAGPAYAPGIIVTQVVPSPGSGGTGVLRYREALARYHPDQQPGLVSLEGYIVANLFAEGLRRAGRDLTTEKLVDAFESIRDYDVGIGSVLAFGMSEHQASHKVWGTVIDAHSKLVSLDMD